MATIDVGERPSHWPAADRLSHHRNPPLLRNAKLLRAWGPILRSASRGQGAWAQHARSRTFQHSASAPGLVNRPILLASPLRFETSPAERCGELGIGFKRMRFKRKPFAPSAEEWRARALTRAGLARGGRSQVGGAYDGKRWRREAPARLSPYQGGLKGPRRWKGTRTTPAT